MNDWLLPRLVLLLIRRARLRLTCFAFDSQSQAEIDKLTCYYYNKHPLLVLNPAKIEMANLKPNIYLLHDIIRDEDMEFIKERAAPRVCDAFVNLTLNNKG